MTPHQAELWLRRVATTALLLCLGVVVLGAYVRLSAAGLGCPDWPGCYGHLTPSGAVAAQASDPSALAGQTVEVGKAWKEMIHRYLAATLGVLIVIIAALAIQFRRERIVSLPLALGLLGLVVAQGVFGMLTVTWRLAPLIVTGHLLFGLSTLAMLFCLWWQLERRHDLLGSAAWQRMRVATPVAAALALGGVVLQIALGGWTSSNYAATACPDFPRCQGSWWPNADFHEAFVLWRGLGHNYEGGVLELGARVAVQLTHRLGAVLLTMLLLAVAVPALRRAAQPVSRAGERSVAAAARWLLAALALQLAIGSAMVLRGFPLWLATAHNAGAALLLLASLSFLLTARGAARRG